MINDSEWKMMLTSDWREIRKKASSKRKTQVFDWTKKEPKPIHFSSSLLPTNLPLLCRFLLFYYLIPIFIFLQNLQESFHFFLKNLTQAETFRSYLNLIVKPISRFYPPRGLNEVWWVLFQFLLFFFGSIFSFGQHL